MFYCRVLSSVQLWQDRDPIEEEKRVAQILEVEHQTKLKGEEVKLKREQVELKSSEAKLEREQVESEKQQFRITVLEANLEKVNIELGRLKRGPKIGDDDSRNSD